MFLSEESTRIFLSTIKTDDRCLILGASGWLGQTAIEFLKKAHCQFLPVSSSQRVIETPAGSLKLEKFDPNEIKSFRPTVVFDFAFQTREYLNILGLQSFKDINIELMRQGSWSMSLDSVRFGLATSSGAAVKPSISLINKYGTDPYSDLKKATEELYLGLSSKLGIPISIARPWSVTGSLVTKVQGFAFSDFANQALTTRKIVINAKSPVFRRYSAIEDLLAVSTAFANAGVTRILESGGPLVDLRDLANEIGRLVGDVEIKSFIDDSATPDNYFNNGLDWESSLLTWNFAEDTLTEQLSRLLLRLSKNSFVD